MSSAYTLPDRLPLWQRLVFAIPILGRIGKEVAYGAEDNLLHAALAFVSLWGCCILLFGVPGLYLPAVGLAPLMLVLLTVMAAG
ncbi:hypothetical protein LCL97_02910 [Seohaeicola saemankumensis]|nr:hypothetical protein [Seohaeicola saemankumensis]MCA0869765.1 hypothetical protein [Seohaeicola saemankumensis]